MPTAKKTASKAAPYVPKISPAELNRQNEAMIKLLNAWDVEENEEEDRKVMQELEKALGPDRTLSSESVF
jgi:hypothetical protein